MVLSIGGAGGEWGGGGVLVFGDSMGWGGWRSSSGLSHGKLLFFFPPCSAREAADNAPPPHSFPTSSGGDDAGEPMRLMKIPTRQTKSNKQSEYK